jgi:hypothetical protein
MVARKDAFEDAAAEFIRWLMRTAMLTSLIKITPPPTGG